MVGSIIPPDRGRPAFMVASRCASTAARAPPEVVRDRSRMGTGPGGGSA
jgi:hypothetical protein